MFCNAFVFGTFITQCYRAALPQTDHLYNIMSVNTHSEHMSFPPCPCICAERLASHELCGDLCCHAVCGHVRAGPRSNPVVHSGRALLPGAPPSRHGRGGLLQLDVQLHRRNELPETSGEQLRLLFFSRQKQQKMSLETPKI